MSSSFSPRNLIIGGVVVAALAIGTVAIISSIPREIGENSATEQSDGATGSDSTQGGNSSDTGRDACLEGRWAMERGDLDIMVATLVSIDGITVPSGELTLKFEGDKYVYSGNYKLRVNTTPDIYLEAQAVHEDTGTFSTSAGKINFNSETNNHAALEWTAYSMGTSYTVSDGTPTYSYPVPSSAPYRCTTSRLEVDTRGTGESVVTMFFKKVE